MAKQDAVATLVASDNMDLISQVVVEGNLDKLTDAQKLQYYYAMCTRIGLDPLSWPLQYLRLNNKTVLYVTKGATDQIARNQEISRRIVARERIGDVYVVTAQASDKTGRVEESTGAIFVGTLNGEPLCNAMLKAESKAKRRATLSMCGVGMMDESEADDIQGGQRLDIQEMRQRANPHNADTATGVIPQADDSDKPATPKMLATLVDLRDQYDSFSLDTPRLDIPDGMTRGDARALKARIEGMIRDYMLAADDSIEGVV